MICIEEFLFIIPEERQYLLKFQLDLIDEPLRSTWYGVKVPVKPVVNFSKFVQNYAHKSKEKSSFIVIKYDPSSNYVYLKEILND